jgi:DNA-binding CsgD family transcriptional regulator
MTTTTTRIVRPQIDTLREEIEALCSLGLPFHALLPPLLEKIKEFIPSEFVTCIWTPVGHADELRAFSERSSNDSVVQRYLAEFVNKRENETVTPFKEFISRGAAVEDLASFRGVERSELFNEILRPIGGTRAVRARLGLDERAGVGTLTVSRSHDERPFNEEEIRLLESLTGFLDRAVRNNPSIMGYGSVSSRGVAMVKAGGEIVSTSSHASANLLMANGVGLVSSKRKIKGALDQKLPKAVQAMVKKSLRENRMIQVPVENQWGHFAFILHPMKNKLGTTGELALVIEHREDQRLERFRMGREKGLSPQDALVVTEFLNGSTLDETAGQLGLTRETLENRINGVYEKIGVQDRFGLSQAFNLQTTIY